MKKETDLLKKIYKGTHIGSRSLCALLPSAHNPSLRRAIITQINEYDRINANAKSMLSNLGERVKKPTVTAMMAVAEAKLNSSADSSASHLAEVVIQGSNMGIINITKELNRSQLCRPSVYDLGRRLVNTEQANLERIKVFL